MTNTGDFGMGGVIGPVLEPATIVETDVGDFLVGGSGNDRLTIVDALSGLAGMSGDDTLIGGANRDFLFGDYFSASWYTDPRTPENDFSVVGNDQLFGRAGDDMLIGGPGNDSLYGGRGNDLYGISGPGRDLIVEAVDGGIDVVFTQNARYILGENIEKLFFGGAFFALRKDAHGTGNTLDNVLVGGRGDDFLEGLTGRDTLSGAGGQDVLVGGAGRDAFAFGFSVYGKSSVGTGTLADTISDFDPEMDRILLHVSEFYNSSGVPVEGKLEAGQFGLLGGVLTGNEAVIYDPGTGAVMKPDQTVFAYVDPGTILTHHDFEWSAGYLMG